MRILVIGCNHRSTRVEVRERIAFDETAAPRALRMLKERFPEAETVILSTCNRTEFYVARPLHGRPRIEELIEFVSQFHGLPITEFSEGFYNHEDIEAVRHLFRVVSALDSMVLGESQILAQTRAAFDMAKTEQAAGSALQPLFQRAFNVAKGIHSKTTIATGRISIGSVAVDLARQVFSRFDDKIVLMVGAGEIGELTLTHILDVHPKEVWVTNRTGQRAAALLERTAHQHHVPVRQVPYDDWIDQLAAVDIVIASTSSREPILTAKQFQPIPARRKYRPLLLIDLAVPRDIDPAVGKSDQTFVYNIDDLQSVVELTIAHRREAVNECHNIIEQNVQEFVGKHFGDDIGPLVAALQNHFRDMGDRELERIWPKMENLSDHDRALITQMIHRLTQKLLHDPVHLLNEKSNNGATHIYAQTLRVLFNIKESELP
jgi:glutamyl-tRNA reductase